MLPLFPPIVIYIYTFDLFRELLVAFFTFFILHSFVTGVNSFQVYMAYKDYYQMSNSEVQ